MKDFMDDYHAYMESCSEEESDTENSGSGCSTGCLPWLLTIIGILWLIGKIAG
jgi:hypothetical protein